MWRLRWTSWGGPTARARGLGAFKGYEHFPVRIVLSRRQDCRKKLSIPNWVYPRLTITEYHPGDGWFTRRMRAPGSCDYLLQD